MCSQVFLQHLSPLLSLPTFAALWLTILDFMDKYMHAGSSDLLVRMILKQILLFQWKQLNVLIKRILL